MTAFALLLSANAAGFQLPSRLHAPSQRSARHPPPRLDDSELQAVGERATAALDSALEGLNAKPAETTTYLTQEEREEVLKALDAKRFGDKRPPSPPPPADDGWRGMSLNQDVLEERLSAPVTLDDRPSPPPGDAPVTSRAQTRKPYDAMLPLTPGAGGLRKPGAVGDEVAGPPPKPYMGVRALQLDALERTNLLLLLYLLAAGFGSSSPQLLDEGLMFTLRLAASALTVGHVAIAGYGAKLITDGAPPSAAAEGGAGDDDAPPRSVVAAAAWAVRLLLTGPAGLRTLRQRL